ncbi:MerR family transcriptional regulator [Microbacterium aureliae]
MDWSIQQVARLAGTTSRTLRHYDDIGLLPPSRVGHQGYRYYDRAALVRLQRILLLRELGLGLPQIAGVLDRESDEPRALETHLSWLREERTRLERQISAVEETLAALRRGEEPMPETMFDGFDHTAYKEEVEQRWGEAAYAAGDRWWRGMREDERRAWKQRSADLGAAWIELAERGVDPAGEAALAVAARHVDWLRSIPGTPAASGDAAALAAYVRGLAEMYVADPRFAVHYATRAGGTRGAEFVRDALTAYADTHL